MNLTIVHHAVFVADWRAERLEDDDLRKLEAMLLADPKQGAVMAGTAGLRKLRFAPPSRHVGKSGAMRVGYVYVPENAWAILILIFSKGKKSNLSPAERNQIKSLVESLRRTLPRVSDE